VKILFDIIGTIGGIGVIVAALTGFLSKLWADVFMNKKIAEYDRLIEFYKNSLALETEKYKYQNEQIVYKNICHCFSGRKGNNYAQNNFFS